MENLENIYVINKNIDQLRKKIFHLMYNNSQRCLELDSVVLIKIEKLRKNYEELSRKRNKEIKHAYSHTIVRTKTVRYKIERIGPLLIPPKLKVTTIVIGKNSTKLIMTPKWFKVDDEEKILKNIKYPPNITENRPYNTIARFRAVQNETNNSNDFTREPIEVKEDSTETLVLVLDAFMQQFGAKLSFTTEDLSFEESAHRTATGVADLGSAHLLASEHITSAKFALIIDLNYDEIARSEESMQQFLLAFVDAVAQDLSCENDFVRITSVERSKKRERKAEVNLILTTPEKTKTEELANIFKNHAQSGFSNNTILCYIKPDKYQCQWMPVLSYLQLQPFDFDPKHNYDYTKPGVPAELMRGGLPYYLPIGWFRHALKVNNKYKDGSAWLGSSNGPGEWPVAFHGTKSTAVKGITEQGLLVSSVKKDYMIYEAIIQKGEEVNRPGLYVATHCNGGSHPSYTETFNVKTSSEKTDGFQVVFQCRVRPNSYTTHTSPVKVGEAWRIVDPTAVRPYGILLKNTNTKVLYE